MKKLRSDLLTGELVRLVPEVRVNGGCFRHWLAAPAGLDRCDRALHFERIRREATTVCLRDLAEDEGLPIGSLTCRGTNARIWPPGYTGSLSHKGTKVVAALVAKGTVASIGIDIERSGGASELSGIPGLATADELITGKSVGNSIILLSVKEAVFKAAFPVVGQQIGFEEVTLSWKKTEQNQILGVAEYNDMAFDVRCSLSVQRWVGSIALLYN